jgi:hypothetical protein
MTIDSTPIALTKEEIEIARDQSNLSEQDVKRLVMAAIQVRIAEAQDAVDKARELSDTFCVAFGIEFGGYGSGSWYTPPPAGSASDVWESSDYGWQASSQSC